MIHTAVGAEPRKLAIYAIEAAVMASLPVKHVSCASKKMNTLIRVESVNSVRGIVTYGGRIASTALSQDATNVSVQ